MRPLLAFLLLLSSPLFSMKFVLQIARDPFCTGERAVLTVEVQNDNGSLASNYAGWIKLRSTDPTLRIGGDADLTGTGNIFIAFGRDNGLYVYSYVTGNVTVSAEEYMQNYISPVRSGSVDFTVTPGKSDILFNEIMFKSVSSNYYYIELYNASSSTVDLNGLSIYKYKSSTTTNKQLIAQVGLPVPLEPDCYFVIAKDKNRLLDLFAVPTNMVHNFFTAKLDESSHQLFMILNATNRDAFEYSSSSTAENVSLERLSFEPLSAWSASRSNSPVLSSFFGTPGRLNSMATPVAPLSVKIDLSFSKDPEVLPKGETGLINFISDTPGKAAVFLLDASGRKIRELFGESDIGRGVDYLIPFDGTDGNSKPLPVGVYIVNLRFVNDTLGLTARKNILVIVGWEK